jgi:hypothetical protein
MYFIVAQSVCMVCMLILLFNYEKLEDCIKIVFSLIISKNIRLPKNILDIKKSVSFFFTTTF